MKFLPKIGACIALQPNFCHACWRMIKNRIDLTLSQGLLDRANGDDNFLKNIITWDETWVYGYNVETKVQSSQWVSKTSPRPKKHAKCVHTSRWSWRYFLILRVLFTMSFYHKAGQSISSIIWKLCNVFVRQSGKKTWCVAGEPMDAPTWRRALTFIVLCPWLLGQTRDDCPSTASVVSRSRTSWLFPVSKVQINPERSPFWVYWGDQDKLASAFA